MGLPARGKSYLVKMIMRYLRWTGIRSEIFNVGNFRRKRGLGAVPSSFFDKGNAEAQNQREELAKEVQDDMYRWLAEQEVSASFVHVGGRTTGLAHRLTCALFFSLIDPFLCFDSSYVPCCSFSSFACSFSSLTPPPPLPTCSTRVFNQTLAAAFHVPVDW